MSSALKHKKKPQLTQSSSSLWDPALNLDLPVPPELSLSTYTLSFDASTSRLEQAAGNLLQDHSTFRKSFTKKLFTGIKRSLSLHHLERPDTAANRSDSRGLSAEQLISRNANTAQQVPIQRPGTRSARLFQCIRPNMILENSNADNLNQIGKPEFLQ
ncbi:hypothetical protein FBUS_11734 [Fasciolopsis buskii]|uniref:Uncharacterized protein n=1 Tax=Fasciolopsis buskii TaxID=27845 RepID=A0A8E0S3J5_9TREM|nr:hypothetical protein FBUS_07110 [Fasciolopsis buski]KAA0199927.1 hypothetical protein FBUS_11734 [Fasciolopsis buski]